jgi:hypothetical protein
MSDQHPNVRTIDSMTTAIFEQDHDALAKIFTDDMEFHLRGPAQVAGDHKGVGGLLEAVGALFEMTGGKIELDQQFCIAADGWAAEWEHATLGRSGDDATLESRNSFVYRFDGERIGEMWMFLGLLPERAEAFFG